MFKLISSSIIFCLISTPSFAYLGPVLGAALLLQQSGSLLQFLRHYLV